MIKVVEAEKEFDDFYNEWVAKWEGQLKIEANVTIKLTNKKDRSQYEIHFSKDNISEEVTTVETSDFIPKRVRDILDCWFKRK